MSREEIQTIYWETNVNGNIFLHKTLLFHGQLLHSLSNLGSDSLNFVCIGSL